jgi:hypothetical protein
MLQLPTLFDPSSSVDFDNPHYTSFFREQPSLFKSLSFRRVPTVLVFFLLRLGRPFGTR